MDVRRGLHKRIALLEHILARYGDEDDPAMRAVLVDVVQQLRALRHDLARCEKLAAASGQPAAQLDDDGQKDRLPPDGEP